MDLESERLIDGNNDSLETENPKNNGKVLDEVRDVGKSKGKGLRKWRRFRRVSGKETSGNFDSSKKRGMVALPGGNKLRSEGSSSSTHAVSNVLDHVPFYGLDLGLNAESENSEDRNSRSSTAASAPRTVHELGLGIDRSTMRSLSGMNSVGQEGVDQQEKGRNMTKKARGGKIKKENSISSMESDSRSSNFVFLQSANSLMSNGRGSVRSGNYEEDDSDDNQNGDGHLNDVSQTAFSKNDADYEDLAGENSWEVKEEKVDDQVGSGDPNALVESLVFLRLAQEALEREVQKLRDVGKEDALSSDDCVKPTGLSYVDDELQNKLEEALVMLELKNTKISKLEASLDSTEIKIEHEQLMTQRIAAELEYLVISNTIQNLKADLDQTNPSKQQKNGLEQVQLEDANETEEDARKLQNRVGRYAFCFIIQSVLLFVVLYLYVLKFSSQNVEVIPT